jgi:uncharacterized protein YegJ (DUF2314 family)
MAKGSGGLVRSGFLGGGSSMRKMSPKWYDDRHNLMKLMAYRPGDHVKVEFKNDNSGESEWMWVVVDYADEENRLLFGRLDNQPIVQKDIRQGQPLAISYDNVRDHRRFVQA